MNKQDIKKAVKKAVKAAYVENVIDFTFFTHDTSTTVAVEVDTEGHADLPCRIEISEWCSLADLDELAEFFAVLAKRIRKAQEA